MRRSPMSVRVSLLFVLSLLLCMAGRSAMAAGDPDLVLRGGRVYTSPTAEPLDNAIVLIRNGRIVTVSKSDELKIPKSAQVIDCAGKVIVAGFWNSHVHFETEWEGVPQTPAEKVEAH